MTPVFLNPPSSSFSFVEKQEDQNLKLFISPYQDQRGLESQQLDQKAVDNPIWHEESNNHQVLLSSSSSHNQSLVIDVTSHDKLSNCSQRSDQDIMVDKINGHDHDQDHMMMSKISINNKGSTSSVKWMSSKMRLIQKMSNNPQTEAATTLIDHNSDSQNIINSSTTTTTISSNTTVRVCSDCNTTSTPLWRSGPRGPKSLCNACGIRQRKARRAMAEAAAAANANSIVTSATTTTTTTSSYKTKEKKIWRGNPKNKHSKLLDTKYSKSSNNNNNKLCFRNLSFGLNHNYNYSAFPKVFPQDVTEAALLLMELSCGFVHS